MFEWLGAGALTDDRYESPGSRHDARRRSQERQIRTSSNRRSISYSLAAGALQVEMAMGFLAWISSDALNLIETTFGPGPELLDFFVS